MRIAIQNPLMGIVIGLILIAIVFYTHRVFPRSIYRKLYRMGHTYLSFYRGERQRRISRLSTLFIKIAIASLLAIALAGIDIVEYVKIPIESSSISSLSFNVRIPVVIVVDTSGSMADNMDRVKYALRSMVSLFNNTIDIGLVEFSDRIKRAIPPTFNRSYIDMVIDRMEAGGGTMYSFALSTTLSWLRPYRELNVSAFTVFITDGLPGDPQDYRPLLDEYNKLGIPIYTVFIGEDPEGIDETKLIASKTGGEQFTVESIDKLSDTLNTIASKINTIIANINVKIAMYKEIEVSKPLTPYILAIAGILYTILRFLTYRKTSLSF